MKSGGGTLDVAWDVASVTVPMSKVELVVNGEVRESRPIKPDRDAGHWSVRIEKSSWVALMVRGHYADRPEIIAAHSSPVMIPVEGSPFFAAADAVTIWTRSKARWRISIRWARGPKTRCTSGCA